MTNYSLPCNSKRSDLLKVFRIIHSKKLEKFSITYNSIFQVVPADLFRCHISLLSTPCYSLERISYRFFATQYFFSRNSSAIHKNFSDDTFQVTFFKNLVVVAPHGLDIDQDQLVRLDKQEFFTSTFIYDSSDTVIIGLIIKHPSPFHFLPSAINILGCSSIDINSCLAGFLSLHGIENNSKLSAGYCQKNINTSSLIPSSFSGFNGLSLCIITDGRRTSELVHTIDQFLANCPSAHEVLICGPFSANNYPSNKVKVFDDDFSIDDRELRAWITRKKNFLAQKCNFNHLIMLHDRITFPHSFEFKKLICELQQYPLLVFRVHRSLMSERRINDWEEMVGTLTKPQRIRLMPRKYNFSPNKPLIYGAAFAINRHLFTSFPLNESLFWSEAEDLFHTETLFRLNIKPKLSKTVLISPLSRSRGMSNNYLRLKIAQMFLLLYWGRVKVFIQFFKSKLK